MSPRVMRLDDPSHVGYPILFPRGIGDRQQSPLYTNYTIAVPFAVLALEGISSCCDKVHSRVKNKADSYGRLIEIRGREFRESSSRCYSHRKSR